MFSPQIKKIAKQVSKSGFGSVLEHLNLGAYAPYAFFRKTKSGRLPHPSTLGRLLITLGPGFVELARIAGSRSDLVPHQYQSELLNLRYQPKRAKHPPIRRADFKKVFSHLDPDPYDSHLLGHRYQAVMRDGRRVLLTFNYAGECGRFKRDLITIKWILERILPTLDKPQRQLWESIWQELNDRADHRLDLTQVGSRMEILAAHFPAEAKLSVPAVLWEHTTPHLLVQEWQKLPTLHDVIYRRSRAGVAKKYVIRYLLESFVGQYGLAGHFILRPNLADFTLGAGNKVMANNLLGTGVLAPETRRTFLLLLYALAGNNKDLASKILLHGHYRFGRHDLRRPGIIWGKNANQTLSGELWHLLERCWDSNLFVPLGLSMAAESFLFLERALLEFDSEVDFKDGLLSAIKKLVPQIFGVKKGATLNDIAKAFLR